MGPPIDARQQAIKEYWEYMNPCAEMRALGIEVPTVKRPFD